MKRAAAGALHALARELQQKSLLIGRKGHGINKTSSIEQKR